MEALGQVIVVDEDVDVEVEKVEGEGGFAEDDQGAEGEDRRDEIRTGKAKDQKTEERHEQSTVQEDVGGTGGGAGVEEEAEQGESQRRR